MEEEIDCTSKFIKKLRKELGLSQEAFAKRLGVSFTSVNRWENGRSKPIKLAELQIRFLAKEHARQNNNAED